jgi:hypothetical protein
VRLVDDHGVAARRQLLDVLHHVRELLDGGDDDAGPLPRQRLGELLGVLVDLLDDAVRVLELVDRLLQLPVEHEPVGDHDDLVEHLAVVRGVQRRQPVREPGDRVRLARPRRVLHEVRVPGAMLAGVGHERQHGVPLVVAGEERDLLARVVGAGQHEPVQQVEPRVA